MGNQKPALSAPLTAQKRQAQLRMIVKTTSRQKPFFPEFSPLIITIIGNNSLHSIALFTNAQPEIGVS
jgi:hypothetical protein